MVKKEYPRKTEFSKDGAQANGLPAQNSSQKSGESHYKESNTRNTRTSSRENSQVRDNNQQKGYNRDINKRDNQNRDNSHREGAQKENISRENSQRDNGPRENTPRDNHQKNYHNTVSQSREANKDNKDSYRQHTQRQAIKPKTEETVEDISVDIGRIEKEIDLEIKEIRNMRLGI